MHYVLVYILKGGREEDREKDKQCFPYQYTVKGQEIFVYVGGKNQETYKNSIQRTGNTEDCS